MKPLSRIAISKDVICRDVGGEMVLLHLGSGYFFALNAVGMAVWHLLEKGECSVAGLSAWLTKQFGIAGDVAEADILSLLSELLAHDLIREQGS